MSKRLGGIILPMPLSFSLTLRVFLFFKEKSERILDLRSIPQSGEKISKRLILKKNQNAPRPSELLFGLSVDIAHTEKR